MQILVKRMARRSGYTVGRMFIDGVKFCDTLEDTDRDLNKNGIFDGDENKVYSETAIPYGAYRVTLETSPKFGRLLPYVHDVPHFSGILIHRGNTPADTAGCILVGENSVVGKVLNSTPYEKRLVEMCQAAIDRGETITLTIE